MKYDPEYDSYKFTSSEISLLINGLISYKDDPFLDKITVKDIEILLERMTLSEVILAGLSSSRAR